MNIASIKYWKLGQKINVALSLSAGSIIFILALLTYYASEQQLRDQSFEHLKSIKESRKQYILHYFDQIKGQLLTQAENLTITHAIKDFNRAFEELQDSIPTTQLDYIDNTNLDYYNENFLPRLNANLNVDAKANFLLPRENSTSYLQFHYISDNTYDTGKKDELFFSENDQSSYANVHAKYHPIIRNFLHEFSYYDIFLINEEGYIIYSVYKEVDFATNLLTGPYADTNFAKAFKATQALQKGEVVLFDFEPYLPSYSAPASFIATPIFSNGKKQGALVFQMPVDKINEIMTGNMNWQGEGLGSTGECYVLGKDLKIRSQPRLLQEDSTAYFSSLASSTIDSSAYNKIAKMNNAILLQPIETHVAKETIQGRSGILTTKNYLGEEVLSAYDHLDLYGLKWGIIAEISTKEAFEAARAIRNFILLISVGLLIMVYFLSRYLSTSIARPLKVIEQKIKEVAKGCLPEANISPGKDELSAINNSLSELINVQKEVTDFSENIGKGNFEVAFTPRSEEDNLGTALLSMQKALKSNKEEASKRRWSNEGLSQLGMILRKTTDLEVSSNHAVKFLADYIGIQVIGIYLANTKSEKTVLQLSACYAFNREKILQQEIEAGFGLIGQVYLEGKTSCLQKVPDNYLNIRSGLGDSAPRFVAIIPMIYNEEVHGILEVATFKRLSDHEVSFLEKASESMAASFYNLKSNKETLALLERSKKSTEQLKEKEFEMRQSLEELEATRETFHLKERKLKKEIANLKQQLEQE